MGKSLPKTPEGNLKDILKELEEIFNNLEINPEPEEDFLEGPLEQPTIANVIHLTSNFINITPDLQKDLQELDIDIGSFVNLHKTSLAEKDKASILNLQKELKSFYPIDNKTNYVSQFQDPKITQAIDALDNYIVKIESEIKTIRFNVSRFFRIHTHDRVNKVEVAKKLLNSLRYPNFKAQITAIELGTTKNGRLQDIVEALGRDKLPQSFKDAEQLQNDNRKKVRR